MGPSTASMTALIDAWRPAGRISKPPVWPRWEAMKSGAAEGLQNLGEKALRCAGGAGQIGQAGALMAGQRGQMNHHAHAIVGGSRQLHGELDCPIV